MLEVGHGRREVSECDLAQEAANADKTRAAVKAGTFIYSTLVAGHVLRHLVLLPIAPVPLTSQVVHQQPAQPSDSDFEALAELCTACGVEAEPDSPEVTQPLSHIAVQEAALATSEARR